MTLPLFELVAEAEAAELPASAAQCSECRFVFTAEALAAEDATAWGHPCNVNGASACESYRAPIAPDAEPCPHVQWLPTVTVWPGENFERFTWTCAAGCGEVRGRA